MTVLVTFTFKLAAGGAAGAIWDQLTTFLRTSGITVLVIALLIAFVAWALGPSNAAAHLRNGWNRVLHSGADPGSGAEPSPVATFVARSKNVLRGLGVAVAFIVLIVWNHPTALTVLGIAVLLLAYLAILELVSRSAAPSPVVDPT